jgi:quinoprotein glucose dehydrogenase
MPQSSAARPRNRSLLVMIVGALLALIGLILAIGGAWLAILGGSVYYLLIGALLFVSGYLLLRGRALGAWLYLGAFILSAIWGLAEAGLDGWALIPFVIGPTVLLVLVLLTLPLLQPDRWRWRTAFGVAAGVVLVVAVAGFAVSRMNQPAVGAMPGVIASTVADPSPMRPGTDWPAYGGSYAAQRYSPLGQITPANVGKLTRAWIYHTGDMPKGNPKDSKYGAETTPLKVGDTLYLCSATNIMIALDPATGKQRWRYDPQVSDDWIPYTAACRGVAYYAVPDAEPAAPVPPASSKARSTAG